MISWLRGFFYPRLSFFLSRDRTQSLEVYGEPTTCHWGTEMVAPWELSACWETTGQREIITQPGSAMARDEDKVPRCREGLADGEAEGLVGLGPK